MIIVFFPASLLIIVAAMFGLVVLPFVFPIVAGVAFLIGRSNQRTLLNQVVADRRTAESRASVAIGCSDRARQAASLVRAQPERSSSHLAEARAAAVEARQAFNTARTALTSAEQAASKLRKEPFSKSAGASAAENLTATRVAVAHTKKRMRDSAAAASDAAWSDLRNRLSSKGVAALSSITDPARFLFRGLRDSMNGTRDYNRSVAEASMAVCALLTTADGEVSRDERERVEMLIETNAVLGLLSSRKLKRRFTAFCEAILDDPRRGRADARDIIRSSLLNEMDARAVLQIGLLALVPGQPAAEERQIISEICDLAGVSPPHYLGA